MIFGFGLDAIIMVVIMVIALIGMIIAAKKQELYPAAKPIAIVCIVVIIACAVGVLFRTGMFGEDKMNKKIIDRETKYLHSSAHIAGKYIADKFPGSKILLLVDDNPENKEQAVLLKVFKDALGQKAEILGTDCPRSIPVVTVAEGEETAVATTTAGAAAGSDPLAVTHSADDAPTIQDIMTAETVNYTVAKYPDINMIVSFIGLPYDLEHMNIWYEEDPEKRIKVALIGGNIFRTKSAIASGLIVMAVNYKPDLKFDTSGSAPEDPQEAFDKRYVMITPENINEFSEKYPKFFVTETQ